MADTFRSVQEYYGSLKDSSDLKTNACTCDGTKVPESIKKAIAACHSEIIAKYYGCGLVFPEVLSGCRVLDLGSGSGRDCYVLSQLVGEKGFVTGIDMTQEQLDVAVKHIQYHMDKFGYAKPNVAFIKGYIEQLSEAGIQPESQDVIVSNCVINLSPDKRAVLAEAFKALKPGGEMYFSDVYSDRILSEDLRRNEVLWGECISGALHWEELMKIATDVGFSPPLLVKVSEVTVENAELQNVIGDARFCSATYRLFKVDHLDEPENEVAINLKFKDANHGVSTLQLAWDIKIGTCCSAVAPSSLADILSGTRYGSHLKVESLKGQTDSKYQRKTDFLKVNPFKVLGPGKKSDAKSFSTSPSLNKSCC